MLSGKGLLDHRLSLQLPLAKTFYAMGMASNIMEAGDYCSVNLTRIELSSSMDQGLLIIWLLNIQLVASRLQ
jgi:hypothetical protein